MGATSTDSAVTFLNGQIAALHTLGQRAAAAYDLVAWILSADPQTAEERGEFAFRVARLIGHTGGPLADAIDRAAPWIVATAAVEVPFVGTCKGACVGALRMVEAVGGMFRAVESVIAMANELEAEGEQHGLDRALSEDWTAQLLESLHDDEHYLPAGRVEKLATIAGQEAEAAIERVTNVFYNRVASPIDTSIPAEFLTRVVSKAEAARLHAGRKVENPTDYIKRLVKAGTLTPPIGGGKHWRFDIREFPESARGTLR
jgi:hypothetical protein